MGSRMLNLDFSSALPGTILDKDGQGTGFSSVQTNTAGNQYDPTRIDLDPITGSLLLTATQGTNAVSNTLKNALQFPVDATESCTLSTRLRGPFTNLTSSYQQGGVFLGSSQDNYVKLMIVNSGSGLGLQFYQEQNAVGSSVGGDNAQQVTGLDWASVSTLDLFLTGDPLRSTITAAYRINSDTDTPTVLSALFSPSPTTPFFSPSTSGGILAFTKDAADVPITFDSFGIAQDVKINFQPSTAAIPSGYIQDSGDAYNSIRGFGWVNQASPGTPLSISNYARDRNRANVDQRLDSLLHMQYRDRPAATWEYALPNGNYSVTVSVGDKVGGGGVYDSKHTINVEGVSAIKDFQGTSKQEYQLASVKVNVTDGKLTVDAIGGINTKLNYLEIVNVTPGSHPSVTDSSIASNSAGIYLNAAVNVDVSLPTVGAGVDQTTLNTTNVQLYRTQDNTTVAGIVGTSGGGDALVYQPSVLLDANTNYTFRITNGVRDESGAAFIPYSRTFNTGPSTDVSTTVVVSFTKSTAYAGDPISSLIISPDGGSLYGVGLDGKVHRWTIEAGGNLSNLQTFAPAQLAGRAIIGVAFDPNNPNNLWISHNDPLFPMPALDFSGKISKLTLNGTNFDADVQDYVVGLPRSGKDHLSNSLVFGPDGYLYMTQGSNSAMGAPDATWYRRAERLLSGAVLQIDPTRTTEVPFNVQTQDYKNSSGVTTTGNYNPYAIDASVKIFATGVRNAYDLVWHSNGNLYVPAHGSAAGGNTPNNPVTTANEGLTNVATQNDYLFKVVQGGYYGHPNPEREEYILNGGNPTNAIDPAEVVAKNGYEGYPVGTQPDPDYQGFAYDFGRNRSANGAIEYKSDTFGGALKNKLLVVEYSSGDDILALAPGIDGNVSRGNVTQVISGLTDPVDLIEDTKRNLGNLYVAELIEGGTSGQISLLKVS